MKLTKHEEKLRNLKAAFCDCPIRSIDPKDHKEWCCFRPWAVCKDQPEKEQEEAERR